MTSKVPYLGISFFPEPWQQHALNVMHPTPKGLYV